MVFKQWVLLIVFCTISKIVRDNFTVFLVMKVIEVKHLP